MELLDVEPLLARCSALQADGEPGLGALLGALDGARLTATALSTLTRPDPTRPYGRRVLQSGPHVEAMLATWTPGVPCAPHDHGGSVGGVAVVQGEAVHRVWRVTDGALRPVLAERVGTGGLLSCGPDLVHSMEDGGAEQPLVTLHLYAGPIDHMVVYDLEQGRTLVVEGGCGAWVPDDQPELIRAVHDGLRSPEDALRC